MTLLSFADSAFHHQFVDTPTRASISNSQCAVGWNTQPGVGRVLESESGLAAQSGLVGSDIFSGPSCAPKPKKD
jgi:hypothetical protein